MSEFVSTTTITTEEYNRLRDNDIKVKGIEADKQVVKQNMIHIYSALKKATHDMGRSTTHELYDEINTIMEDVRKSI